MVRCLSCGGTYAPILADGMQYFHVCPPLTRAELEAAVHAGALTLPKGETVDEAHARRAYERVNKRDENIVPHADPRRVATIKLAGAGVETLP